MRRGPRAPRWLASLPASGATGPISLWPAGKQCVVVFLWAGPASQVSVESRHWAGCAATSQQASGKPGLQLSHELYLHGKYEPLWTGSKHRGFHCSGFRPSVWGPSPCLAFLQVPGGLGASIQGPQPSHLPGLGDGPWGVTGLACPPPPFQMLLPDASKELRSQCSDFLIPALHSIAWRQGGRHRGRPFTCNHILSVWSNAHNYFKHL